MESKENQKFAERLLNASSEIGVLIKDASNPFHKSKYLSLNALLDAVKPVLAENGLLLTQRIENNCVITRIECPTFDKFIESELELPNTGLKKSTETITFTDDKGKSVTKKTASLSAPDVQRIGSAISYYRRYTLQSLLGIQAEDDDGSAASNRRLKAKKRLTEPQYRKLLLPQNQHYIPKYLEQYEVKIEWATELEQVFAKHEEHELN